MVIGPSSLLNAFMPIASLPAVAMSPNDLIVMASSFVPAVPALMPAAKVPVVAILPKEVTATAPLVAPAAMPKALKPESRYCPRT